MPWTEITRRQYRRETKRYASDTTDAEWLLLAPHMPLPKRLGRPRTTDLRSVVDALLYLADTGCQWRQLPREFPLSATVRGYFDRWSRDGLWATINHLLVAEARERQGREASPSAGVIDSRSVKTTESGGPRGFDAGKTVKGRKRHIVTDTIGLLVAVKVQTADTQDRDGAVETLLSLRHCYPWLRHVFADAAYSGDMLMLALAGQGRWTLEIIKRSNTAEGFEVLPRRWVVERTFAWLRRCRRLAKDFEATLRAVVTWIYIAHVRLLTRRLARPC